MLVRLELCLILPLVHFPTFGAPPGAQGTDGSRALPPAGAPRPTLSAVRRSPEGRATYAAEPAGERGYMSPCTAQAAEPAAAAAVCGGRGPAQGLAHAQGGLCFCPLCVFWWGGGAVAAECPGGQVVENVVASIANKFQLFCFAVLMCLICTSLWCKRIMKSVFYAFHVALPLPHPQHTLSICVCQNLLFI